MKKRISFGVPVAVAGLALIAAGCGSAGTTSAGSGSGYAAPAAAATSAASTQADTVATRHTGLGNVLVDAQGRTLYLFEKDKGMTSTCSGACASIWPPLTATKVVAGSGLSAAKLSVAKQPGGASVVTYAGASPLHVRRRRQSRGDQGAGPGPVRC